MAEARATFDRAVAEHQGTVLRVCRSILRDEHLGADAAQETFLRLWKRITERREPARSSPATRGSEDTGQLGGWLRSVAVTISVDQLRRVAARPLSLVGADTDCATDAADPNASAETSELEARFERALETLSEGQRTVFLLRHSGGLSLREVATTLDVALPTAKTHFARACLRLQEALRPFHPDHDDEHEHRDTSEDAS